MALHTTRRQILFGECDPAGIVFYPRYFEMVDANTSAMFCANLDLSQRDIELRYGILGCPMVNSSAKFHTPSTYGDAVEVSSQVIRVGNSSIVVKSKISHADGRLIAEMEDVRVWAVRRADGIIKSARVPDDVRARF